MDDGPGWVWAGPSHGKYSASLTVIERRTDTPVQARQNISGFANTYIDYFQILTDRIRKFNAKLICDTSGLRLVRVLEFTLKMMTYEPIERGGWQALLELLANKLQ